MHNIRYATEHERATAPAVRFVCRDDGEGFGDAVQAAKHVRRPDARESYYTRTHGGDWPEDH